MIKWLLALRLVFLIRNWCLQLVFGRFFFFLFLVLSSLLWPINAAMNINCFVFVFILFYKRHLWNRKQLHAAVALLAHSPVTTSSC